MMSSSVIVVCDVVERSVPSGFWEGWEQSDGGNAAREKNHFTRYLGARS